MEIDFLCFMAVHSPWECLEVVGFFKTGLLHQPFPFYSEQATWRQVQTANEQSPAWLDKELISSNPPPTLQRLLISSKSEGLNLAWSIFLKNVESFSGLKIYIFKNKPVPVLPTAKAQLTLQERQGPFKRDTWCWFENVLKKPKQSCLPSKFGNLSHRPHGLEDYGSCIHGGLKKTPTKDFFKSNGLHFNKKIIF